ncbi:MAG: iron ABC transporter permease [Anaerolineales bacterium]|nr:iron ABC transporter permease [Anaerolineales bacterium]MCL4257000.1 iron ABC transporter permease [Anaerolineales bacterium]
MRPFIRRHPFITTAILLVGAFLLSIALGSVFIPPESIFKALLGLEPLQGTLNTILFEIRLPHAVLITLTGAALAASGTAYQGLFRNPLADPYLIGIASGAGLGAVTMMARDWPKDLLGFYSIPAAAFAGALLTVAIVYWIARLGKTVPVTTLILAGVAVSTFATSLSSFLMLQSESELRRAIAWLLGGAALNGWQPVIAMLPYVTVGIIILLLSGHQLNVLQTGEEQAQQLGLPVERIKLVLIVAASLAAAAAVAFSGMIGFIGLVIPHSLRLIWGGDHRRLLPLSLLGGAAALLLADVVARTILPPQVIPVGIITALVGVPFFLWLLRRAKAQMYW